MDLASEQLAGPLSPLAAASRPAPATDTPKRAKRHRIALLVALGIVASACIVVALVVPNVRGIYLFGLYAIPSNSLLPIPHEPGLLYFAQFHNPLWLAIAGSLGAGTAAFTDYYFIGRAMRVRRIARLRDTRTYRWAVKWLMRRPFLTVIAFAGLPLPISVIRILAPSSGFPLRRYVLAMMIGRLPRFFVVAWVGNALAIPAWAALALFATAIVVVLTVGWLQIRGANDATET